MNNVEELSDISSESVVIGTLVYHPDFILHSNFLKPRYFFNEDNGCIYWAISELYQDGIMEMDALNISQKIESNNAVNRTLQRFNVPRVQEWIDYYKQTARHTLKEYLMYANKVLTYAFKRELVAALNQLTAECYDKRIDLGQLDNLAYKHLDDITTKFIVSNESQTLGEQIDSIWDEIESRRSGDGVFGIPSKYEAFNDYFTYEPGELVVIQAKYKEGKSAFILNEVVNKLESGIPTLVIDTEMKTRLYTERLLAHLTGIPTHRIKSGAYTEEEAKLIEEKREWIKKQPFVHKYDPNITMEQVYSLCKMWKHKMGLQFVVYDYIKSNETENSSNYNILGAKCDYLKNNIAGELDLSVMAACQLNRQGEVADSIKINRYLSVGIKWGEKSKDMVAKDGIKCGNYYAKIYVNRLGKQMQEDDEADYIDFDFDGNTMTIEQSKKQHDRGADI